MLGEPDILQALMAARTRISAAAWLVVRDTHAAEDIFQNVALKAMTRGAVFETCPALMSWAFITARREGIDWLRRHRRESAGLEPELLEVLEAEWCSAPAPPAGERLDALRECLGLMPEASIRLLKLRYFEGHGCGEVARRLGIGLDAVYKRVSRLHESLRTCVTARLEQGGAARLEGEG